MTEKQEKFFGTYPGIVVSVDNTLDRNTLEKSDEREVFQRVRVEVPGVDPPGVSPDTLPEALVSYSVAGSGWGQFSPLYPKDAVLVTFFEGDPTLRTIMGRYHTSDQVPVIMVANYPFREGFISRSGHAVIFDNYSKDSSKPSGITILSRAGDTIKMRDKRDDIRLTTASKAYISIRGTASDSEDPNNANQGILIESAPDEDGDKYKVRIDEENEEIEVISKNGYKIVIRDADQDSGTEKKGITIRATANRSIVFDEELGKLFINHDGEVVIDGSKTIIDSDLDVNGKIDATGDINSTAGDLNAPAGVITDSVGSLTVHNHAIPPPQGGFTVPPRT